MRFIGDKGVRKNIFTKFILLLALTGCKPDNIQQHELNLEQAITNRDLTHQYSILTQLAEYDKDKWHTDLLKVKNNLSLIERGNTAIANNHIVDAQALFHKAKQQINSQQVDSQLRQLSIYRPIYKLVNEVTNYNDYLKSNSTAEFFNSAVLEWNIINLNELYQQLIKHQKQLSQLISSLPDKANHDPVLHTFLVKINQLKAQTNTVLTQLIKKQLSEFAIASHPVLTDLYTTTANHVAMFDGRVVHPMMQPLIKKTKIDLQHWEELLLNTKITLQKNDSMHAPLVTQLHNAYQQLITQNESYTAYIEHAKHSLKLISEQISDSGQNSEFIISPITINKNILTFSDSLRQYAYIH